MKTGFFFKSLMFFLVLTSSGMAQEITRWRGPQSNGNYSETGLLKQWPVNGPEVQWSFNELGLGHSSAVASGEFIYSSGMIDEMGYLFKLKLNGELVYKKQYGPEFIESYQGTRGSPVIAGDKIYLLSAFGVLNCLKESDGSLIWKQDLVSKFGGSVITWGYNETPVVEGDIVYCTPGGAKNSVVALNRHNGNLIWSCPGKGELTAYCTPLLFKHNGRKILATHTASHLLGIDAETGVLLWSHPQPNQWSVHANTPIYHDGGLFYFSGYGQGSGMLTLNQDGSKVTLAWENKTMDSRMGGAVIVDGYIYGSGDNKREWKCINWKTGENTYVSTEVAKGVVIYADGMLYCYSEKGELALVKADPAKFEVISRTKVTLGSEQHWAHPMIYRGTLYLRHGKSLIAYKIK